MADGRDRIECFKNTYRKYGEDINDVTDWQHLESAAIYRRRYMDDLKGAIEAEVKAIGVMRTMPQLAEATSTALNYLADMYLECNAIAEAETAIREAIELARPHFPCALGDNLTILADIQRQKGEYADALDTAEQARRAYQQGEHAYGAAQALELTERIKAESAADGRSSRID